MNKLSKVAGIVTSFSIFGSALVSAADDCAKCEITTERRGGFHADPRVCPGPNAVVCDYSYIMNSDSKCVVGSPDLSDCYRVVRQKVYVAKKYAPGTCGVRGPNRTITGCGIPGGAPINKKRDSYECSGDAWNQITLLPVSQAFALAVHAIDGPLISTAEGTAPLGRSVVAIPAALLKRDDADFSVDGEEIILDLLIEPREPTRFAFPEQAFKPRLTQGGVRLIYSRVEEGRVHLSFAVARASLGAVRDYEIGLLGLSVSVGARPEITEAPMGKAASGVHMDESALVLLAELSSGGKSLTSGAGLVARYLEIKE